MPIDGLPAVDHDIDARAQQLDDQDRGDGHRAATRLAPRQPKCASRKGKIDAGQGKADRARRSA
jgi:hypothetical protein